MMRRLHSLRRYTGNALLLAVCAAFSAAHAAEPNGKGAKNAPAAQKARRRPPESSSSTASRPWSTKT